MGVSVTENVTSVTATGDVTVEITENITNVAVSDSTATLTVTPTQTTVEVSGNTTSINVTGTDTSVNVTQDVVGTSGAQNLIGSLTIKGTKPKPSIGVNFEKLLNLQMRGSSGYNNAGTIAAKSFSTAPPSLAVGVGDAGFLFSGYISPFILPCDADTGSGNDNVVFFGSSFNRYRIVYSASGVSTSSDANEKQDIAELNDAELRVATRCKALLKKYRRTEAIEEKGDGARIHFGIIAQELEDAFTAEGLDAHRYAMFMEDTGYFTEEGGFMYQSLEEIPVELRDSAIVKTRLGVRYEQLLAFIIAAL